MSSFLPWPSRSNKTPLTVSFLGFMTALAMLGFLCAPAPLLATGTTSTATASWDRNTDSDTSGYKLHFGTSSRNYTTTIDVGAQTSYVVSNLQNGLTYYVAVTAYTGTGVESSPSDEVSYVVPGAGMCDFNNDGKTDILWRNTTTGANYVWYMNGVTVSGGADVTGMDPASGWTIVGR